MTQANYVSYSNNMDSRFLNPFEKGLSKGASFFGQRYGNAQFIFIICATISLGLIQLLSSDFNKTLIMIILISYYLFLYYNLSCYLIPDNHERCFVLAWICIATVILITILVLFHNAIFKKKYIGGHNENNLFANLKENIYDKILGGTKYKKGGSNCNKRKKYEGGEEDKEQNLTLEEYLKSQLE